MPVPLKFACAMPVGAWHDLLPAAFESLASQSEPLEVAFLDASGDPRVAQAANASGLDFVYRRSGPDGGQSAAIAEGWAELGGDILFWLNADDRLTPGALTQVAAHFGSADKPDVVFGHSDFINRRGKKTGQHDQLANVSDYLLRSNTISQPSCFARRSWIERVGGVDAQLHYVMDWDLWARLYKSGAKFKQTEETYSEVYMGEDTKTGLVSRTRLAEVYGLVQRNAGHWNAFKATASLYLHTLTQRRAQS